LHGGRGKLYKTYIKYPECDIEHGKGALQTLRRYSFIGAAFIKINISDT